MVQIKSLGKARYELCFFLLFILVGSMALSGMAQESDPEIKDLHARVRGIVWEKYMPYQEDPNQLEFVFTVDIEIWNPYDKELTSYGSSSCPWGVSVQTAFLVDTYDIVESLLVCTSDWAPRSYASSLSNVTMYPTIYYENSTTIIDNGLPHGLYEVNGEGGTFSNHTDKFYGVQFNVTASGTTFEYEDYPENWGEILYRKADNPFHLNLPVLPLLAAINVLVLAYRRFIRFTQ